MDPSLELRLHRLLHGLVGSQEEIQQVPRAVWTWLREAQRFFEAEHACVGVLAADRRALQLRFETPRGGQWDHELLAAFLRDERTLPPETLLVAPVHRRNRLWGVMALQRPRPFAQGEGRALARLTRTLSDRIALIEESRAREVQERIERKIMDQLRPQDIFYRILHGLRSLTSYDHSSGLLICSGDRTELELVAAQAAWSKTKSRHVGRRFPMPPNVRALLEAGRIFAFQREEGGWRSATGENDHPLAELLAYHGARQEGAADEPSEQAMLCAPLISRDTLLGAIVVASQRRDWFGDFEAELLRRFQLHATVAIRNLRETESLRRDVLRAERKHAMANMARGISHDVNNAIGAVLPTVQQLQAEVEEGTVDLGRLREDLAQIETAMQTCRRVFRGLLSFARSKERSVGQGDLRRALDNALAILRPSLDRSGVRVEVSGPGSVVSVRSVQHELEQLFLNLGSNARDAMPSGGTLSVTIAPADRYVDVAVSDEGVGMSDEEVERSEEAFYSTKSAGNGLGLSICRSIVADMRGQMRIDSEPGRGTTVHLRLPAAVAGGAEVSA